MDIAKSFTFMFEDPEWLRKMGIGTLVTLASLILMVILVGFIPLIAVLGYSLVVTRNVMNREPMPLPEWTDWGGFFMRGLKLVVVFLIWALPLIVFVIPFGIGSAFLNNTDSGGAQAMGTLFVICGSCLALLWGLLLMVITPAIYVRVAETDSIAAGFEFGRLWAFTRDNITNVIITILLTWVASLVASIIAMAGIIAIGIGLIVSIPLATLWQMLVQAHLYGQVGANNKSVVV